MRTSATPKALTLTKWRVTTNPELDAHARACVPEAMRAFASGGCTSAAALGDFKSSQSRVTRGRSLQI